MELNRNEKEILIRIARDAIGAVFGNKKASEPDIKKFPFLKSRAGAFVTLTKNEDLRGCIGYIISEQPLYKTVSDAAIGAAFRDPRFEKLSADEFDKTEIEISVLSEPFPMKEYDDIIIGKHGLILEEGPYRGLLLPQVPIEHGMNRDQFLDALCSKAGIYTKYWKEKKLNIKMFTANVFSEKELRS